MASKTSTLKAPGRVPGKLSGLLDTLYNEHRYILSLLDNLEQQTLRLKSGKVPDYQLLLDSIDYLTHYPDRYHHSREDLLFAGMLTQDREFTPHIERLQREHATLRNHNNRLFAELSAAVEGAPVDRPALLCKLRTYIKHYRQHINYESREIFPRARGSLRPSLLNEINDKTRYLDDPLFGDRVSRQYHRLARNLNLRVTNLRDQVMLREYLTLETLLENVTRASDRLPGFANVPNPFKLVSPRPSWQARAMNLFTRSVMKPVMRFSSLESLRAITLRADELGEKNLPPDIKSEPVNHADYQAEWIRIKGKRPRKVLLYLPGGGFIIRTAVQHKVFVARMCRAAGTKALLVHYRLAPEVPFPGGLEDCLAAYHDLLRQGFQPSDITLAGDSAGGGLVLSTLLALRDEGTELPARAIVLSPLADLAYKGNSRRHNKRADPVLPTQRIAAMQELYIGESLPDNRYAAPVLADFVGLPPILGVVGSTEILLDDTLRAALQAGKADVPFYLEVWEKMPHVFPIFSILPESEVAIERIGKFIREGYLHPLPKRYGRHKATRREQRALALK
jgi:acetyl esterase/lipase/hemerythrin-like domain-containing protein